MTESLLHRIGRMPREEMRWRGRVAARTTAQRLAMRVRAPRWDRGDLAQALAPEVGGAATGAAIGKKDWCAVHDALAAAIRARTSRFVLDPASSGRLRSEITARWPAAPSLATERAERLLAGRYDILGYRDLAFAPDRHGDDWHFDPVHNRRAPRVFWADVPYLDPAIGDHKIIWEINRHQHWLQFGRALWLTGDPRYRDGIIDQLESWLAANPPLVGINWASMLEIGFRSMSWTWAIHFLLARHRGSDLPTTVPEHPWLVDMLVGLDHQLTHLEQNLSYYFSPNTHLTGEALALYVVGVALPELAGSPRWIETGRRILVAEIARQIQADGGHAEHSAHYQRYTLDFYLLALLTARRAQDAAAIACFTDAATRLAEFTRVMADDRGHLPLIGDDDGGVLWPFTGREYTDVRDSLALAAAILDRPSLAPGGVPEEVWWLAGGSAAGYDAAVDPRAHGTAVVSSKVFADTGLVVSRDGAGGHAVFDAGAHGYLNGGHAHADALAITLNLANRPLLVDPGTSTYTMAPALRDQMRSSMSHNTLTIDGRTQSIPAGPFHWQSRADGQLRAWRHNPAFDWAEASHDGYAPVRHRRTLFRSADTGWLVVDEIIGDGPHSATAHWHFDPTWTVRDEAPGRLRAVHPDGGAAWLLYDEGAASLLHGDRESGLGWHAPAYGTLVPAWTARVTQQSAAPFAMVTWIGSGAPQAQPPLLQRVDAASDSRGTAIAARVVAGDRASVFLLRPGEPPGRDTRRCTVLDFETNARLLHYVTSGDRLSSLDLIDGTSIVALHEGWLSITSDQTIADLHVVISDRVLDLWASTPPSALHISGEAIAGLHRVRLNGGETSRLSVIHPNTVLIHSADWGENIFPRQYGAAFA